MPRKRTQVAEDPSELKQIQTSVAGTGREQAIRMLRLLEEDPERTLGEVASLLNCSERTVHRWWKLYVDGGIAALLAPAALGGKRPMRISPSALAAFRNRARQGFSELKEAQTWLVREYGISYSLSRISALLKESHQGASPVPDVQNPSIPDPPPEPAASLTTEAALLRFINKLPLSSDITEWILAFRDALCELLEGVDRVSVGVNTFFLVGSTPIIKTDQVGTRLVRQIPESPKKHSAWAVMQFDSTGPPCRQLVEMYCKVYPDQAAMQTPYPSEYYCINGNYIGSIILWVNVNGPPIPARTLALISRLRPFFVFALTDAVARYECDNPVHAPFKDALIAMSAEAGLSPQESKVILLRLLGKSYKSIAEITHVSVGTIKKHFSSIHRKTQTGCQAELFAKYFTGHSILDEKNNRLRQS